MCEKIKVQNFVCIEYPGVINNIDNALKTLGGLRKISEVYCEENRRIELRFRPDDLYCKPACGEKYSSTNLLIKIVRRKKKTKDKLPEENTFVYKNDLLGVIHTTFKFNNMCDFQYMPLKLEKDGTYSDMYSSLLPEGIVDSSWLNIPAPLYLPPAAFSRMDTPQEYRFRRDTGIDFSKKVPINVICRTRQKRTHYAIFHSFKDGKVPESPLSGAANQFKYKFLDQESYERLKGEFEQRPIWSKSALSCRLGYTNEKLKFLLPTLSYYFNNGPWRNLWVRFGYDPRGDPNAWIYQTFDYRLRQAGGVKTLVEAKRSYANYILPYKNANASKKKISVIKSTHFGDSKSSTSESTSVETDKQKPNSDIYIFTPNVIPPYRQMFYQFCDIHVPEIQSLLEENILCNANKVCSEKNGWLPPGVESQCRDIISNLVETALADKNSKGEMESDIQTDIRESSNSEGESPHEDNFNDDDG